MSNNTKKTGDKVDEMMGGKHEEKMGEEEGGMKRKRSFTLDSDSVSGVDSASSSDFSVKKTPKLEDEWATSNNQGGSQKSSSQIPAPMKPKCHVLVALGVETTSLDEDCDIIQLTCSNVDQKGEDFSCYILPETKDQIFMLNTLTAKVNGLTFMDGILKQNGQEVKVVDLEEGLLKLIEHFGENTVLISHYTTKFQSTHLIRKLLQKKLTAKFSQKVVGFIDSLSLFGELKRGLNSYALINIVKYYSKNFTEGEFKNPVGEEKNMTKIRNLAALIRCHVIPDNTELLYKHSITVDRVIEEIKQKI